MADKPHVGDEGTRIRLDCGQNVTTASTRRIRYVKPDKTTGYWDASQDGTYTDRIYADTTSTTLDQPGEWELYSYIEKGAWKGHGEVVKMQVYPVT
jgi:hypothetical protein